MLLATWTIESLLNLRQIGDPQMRPSGGMYAYVLQGNVLLSPLAGGTTRQVHSGRRPRWSPDSRRLAFVAGQDGTDQIFFFNAQSALTVNPGGKSDGTSSTDYITMRNNSTASCS